MPISSERVVLTHTRVYIKFGIRDFNRRGFDVTKFWIALIVSLLLLASNTLAYPSSSHSDSYHSRPHVSSSHHSTAPVHVKAYYRKNGTYVPAHYRSHPDHSYNNNWSVSPNVNPYTGKPGTKHPTPDDKPPRTAPIPPIK